MSGLMTIPSELSTAVNKRLLSRKYYANVVNVPKPNAINPLKTILFIIKLVSFIQVYCPLTGETCGPKAQCDHLIEVQRDEAQSAPVWGQHYI